MKKVFMLLVMVAVFGFSVVASATLTTIGTASYGGQDYKLIYEDNQGLIWLDYTNPGSFMNFTWPDQQDWVAGLGGNLTVSLLAGYSTSIDWTTGWRLPSAGNNPQMGFNQITSEMGHLYYESLQKTAGGPLGDPSPFENLRPEEYWSGTEYYIDPLGWIEAWYFDFNIGDQWVYPKFGGDSGLAVHPGEVVSAPVPEPSTMLLLGSGLLGLWGFRKKFKK